MSLGHWRASSSAFLGCCQYTSSLNSCSCLHFCHGLLHDTIKGEKPHSAAQLGGLRMGFGLLQHCLPSALALALCTPDNRSAAADGHQNAMYSPDTTLVSLGYPGCGLVSLTMASHLEKGFKVLHRSCPALALPKDSAQDVVRASSRSYL